MMFKFKEQLSPTHQLLGYSLLALLIVAWIIYFASARPWYGMTLTASEEGLILSQLNNPSVQDITLPVAALALQTNKGEIALENLDLIEEPDVFNTYDQLRDFRKRQQVLYDQMQTGALTLVVADQLGQRQVLTIEAQASRPINSFSIDFWVQLITGLGSFIVGAWILVLRPKDHAARCFMLTGVALMASTFAAAIYSSREFALPADLFRILMNINYAGSIGFGFALMGLFFCFPQALVKSLWLKILLATYVLWMLLGFTESAISPEMSVYPVISLLGLSIFVLIWLQWRKSARQPLALAALRWFGIATFLTVFLFIFLQALPVILELEPIVSQGSAFGFFLILYAGLAFGLRRYRLFELDRWAFHVLFWVLAGLALIALDLFFFVVLHWQQESSLLVSLLVCGFLYLPIRTWLWKKLVERPRPDQRELFNRIIEVALAPNKSEYQQRWQSLLNNLFDPLYVEAVTEKTELKIADDGQLLFMPATLHSQALSLSLAEKGRRLFSGADLSLATEILEMLEYANNNRHAWQQGAQDERKRIAQDLHDDLGSRLLTGLHQSELSQVQDTLSLALADMRSIVRGMAGQTMSLEQLLAELREECVQRCEGADISLNWPPLLVPLSQQLDYRIYRQLLSVVREIFSNIIRHANAKNIKVKLVVETDRLCLEIANDGVLFDGVAEKQGLGLSSIKQRVEDLKGSLEYKVDAGETKILLNVCLL